MELSKDLFWLRSTSSVLFKPWSEWLSSHSKETGLVIYLAFLAKVAIPYYMILNAFKKFWPDTVAKFTSGTQDTLI